MTKLLFALSLISAPAFAYDHAEDFKLHPEAEIICSNEGGLFVIDDDKKAVAFGDRGVKELMSLQVQEFNKTGDFKYEIKGLLKFKMFTTSAEEVLTYSVQIKENQTAGTAIISIAKGNGEKQSAEPMECSRR